MSSCTSVEDMFTSLSLELSVAQEKRVEKDPICGSQHQCQVVVGQAQIGGGVLALGRRMEFRSRSRGILFQRTKHLRDYVFASIARVGDLTRQEDWYSLVLCRRRLAPFQGKRSCSAARPPDSLSDLDLLDPRLHTGSYP